MSDSSAALPLPSSFPLFSSIFSPFLPLSSFFPLGVVVVGKEPFSRNDAGFSSFSPSWLPIPRPASVSVADRFECPIPAFGVDDAVSFLSSLLRARGEGLSSSTTTTTRDEFRLPGRPEVVEAAEAPSSTTSSSSPEDALVVIVVVEPRRTIGGEDLEDGVVKPALLAPFLLLVALPVLCLAEVAVGDFEVLVGESGPEEEETAIDDESDRLPGPFLSGLSFFDSTTG